jgi:hypothetical protein
MIPLLSDGSTITHSEVGDDVDPYGYGCRISGQGTLPMVRTVGEIRSTLEEVRPNGELRWSQPTYWLSAVTEGTYSVTHSCHYSTGPQINTYAVGGGIPNIGIDSYDPQTGNRKLEGGRMAGSYATPDGITATWNLTRQGGAPLFPARGRAQ